MKLIGLLIFGCSFFTLTIHAQKMVRVKGVEARWEVSEDITMRQATERALLEARKKALNEAGIMEKVWSVFGHISQNNGEEFLEAYAQASLLTISGLVNITDQKISNLWDPAAQRLYKVVTIDATVKKDESEDPGYVLEIKGIETVYKDGESFLCNIKVYGADSYLKVFWFDATGGALLFPNTYENNIVLKKETDYTFPLSKTIDYLVEKKDKAAPVERVNLIVIATKKNIPYVGEVSYENMLKWIYSLPGEDRCTFYDMFLVKNDSK